MKRRTSAGATDIGGFGLFLAWVSHDSEHHTYNGPNEHRFIRFETPDWDKNAKGHYLKQAKKLSLLDGKTEAVNEVTGMASFGMILRACDGYV